MGSWGGQTPGEGPEQGCQSLRSGELGGSMENSSTVGQLPV